MIFAALAATLLGPTEQTAILSHQTKKLERLGQCLSTSVKSISYRQGDMVNGRYVPDPTSGSAISTTDGHDLFSSDRLPGVDRSRVGDPVRLCVVSIPQGCTRRDTRGIGYRGRNARTGLAFEVTDASHLCGGA